MQELGLEVWEAFPPLQSSQVKVPGRISAASCPSLELQRNLGCSRVWGGVPHQGPALMPGNIGNTGVLGTLCGVLRDRVGAESWNRAGGAPWADGGWDLSRDAHGCRRCSGMAPKSVMSSGMVVEQQWSEASPGRAGHEGSVARLE